MYLGIGTNQGNKIANLNVALQYISELVGKILHISSVYKTAPWGFFEQPDFYNIVVKINCNIPYDACWQTLEDIEKKMGRIKTVKYGPRIIDIDILFFDNEIVQLPYLQIPHPQIMNRKFVLKPMFEIEPQFVHPSQHITIKNLLKKCEDKGKVRKIKVESLKKYLQ